jgi:hypothetical protein
MMNYWKPYENIRKKREQKELIIIDSAQQRGVQVQ